MPCLEQGSLPYYPCSLLFAFIATFCISGQCLTTRGFALRSSCFVLTGADDWPVTSLEGRLSIVRLPSSPNWCLVREGMTVVLRLHSFSPRLTPSFRPQLSPLPSSAAGPSSGPDDAVSREDSSGSAAGTVASPSLVEALSHPPGRSLAGAVRRCGVYLAGPDKVCNRLNSLQQYIEVNREVRRRARTAHRQPAAAHEANGWRPRN